MRPPLSKIAQWAQAVSSKEELAHLRHALAQDDRKGVPRELDKAQRRLERQAQEDERLAGLYRFEADILTSRAARVAVGLDEVGRGPIAGPLAAGAVVLDPSADPIERLDDSKKLSPQVREAVAGQIKASCVAWSVVYASPRQIDERGIMACLIEAFSGAIEDIERQGVSPDAFLLDGNPLHLDQREVNVVKGDARCASIAAASVVAKVERDRLMDELDEAHPGYGFSSNKGYGSESHIAAIRELGLSTVHRASFCTNFL